MIVCHCKAKSDRDIREAASTGARTMREVADRCFAGTDCGGCVRAIRQILAGSVSARLPEPARPRT